MYVIMYIQMHNLQAPSRSSPKKSQAVRQREGRDS